jgi:hypothetical protein
MDRTHFRFFDWTSARALVASAGFREISAYADGGFPLARYLPGAGRLLSHAALRMAPGLFGWQFVIVDDGARCSSVLSEFDIPIDSIP